MWAGCDDKGKSPGAGQKTPTSADLMSRCDQLGKACGDSDKRVEKITQECKQAAEAQVMSGCTEKAVAAYDCYEKELCGKADKVWALDDFRVLVDRHGKCVAERDASRACIAK